MGALREKLSFFSTMNTMVFCAAIAALFAAQVVFSAPANTALSEALELIQTTDPKKPPPKSSAYASGSTSAYKSGYASGSGKAPPQAQAQAGPKAGRYCGHHNFD